MKRNIIYSVLLCLLAVIAAGCEKPVTQVTEEAPEAPFRFDDLQPIQLEAAQKFGIKPLENRDTDFTQIKELVKIEPCQYYDIEWLSHSVPYLTPSAKALLDEIGRDFQDSLKLRGVRPEKIVVTSVLRTMADVKRLQRVNSNAVPNSTHCYGTTFDIAHNSFNPVEGKQHDLTFREMKTVLAHVLYRLRMQKKCWVLVEERQACFHITVNS